MFIPIGQIQLEAVTELAKLFEQTFPNPKSTTMQQQQIFNSKCVTSSDAGETTSEGGTSDNV